MKKLLITLALLLSCAGPQLRDTVSVDDDAFKSVKTFKGIERSLEENGSKYFLRSFYNYKSRTLSHQLYVVSYYHYNWRFYYSAVDLDGKKCEFIPIDDNVFCRRRECTFTEHFAITLTREDMIKGDITLKVYAKKSDPIIFSLTKDMVYAQLEAIKNGI